MVNLVAGKSVVPELIQFEATPERVADEARALLESAERRRRMQEHLNEVRGRLGPPGAVSRTVDAILELMQVSAVAETGVWKG